MQIAGDAEAQEATEVQGVDQLRMISVTIVTSQGTGLQIVERNLSQKAGRSERVAASIAARKAISEPTVKKRGI